MDQAAVLAQLQDELDPGCLPFKDPAAQFEELALLDEGVMDDYLTNGEITPAQLRSEYSSEFKIEVLNWKQQHQASLSETALHFNLSSPSTIWQWQRKFDLKGLSGLNRVRGDPKAMAKHKKVTKPTTSPTIKHRGAFVATLLTGTFSMSISQSSLSTAYPAFMKAFGLGADTVAWLTTGFMLVMTLMIPVSPWLLHNVTSMTNWSLKRRKKKSPP
ncbi:helix-turn-helix domain-containing protein [Streptococcus thermophilus]|uniref:helix-turn-helix domain-containing protein n=1 Tax=Streptococcus thermophilus TaxID=1308 RepID=UPI00300E4D97